MYSRLVRRSLSALTALVAIGALTATANAAASPKTIAKCTGAIVKAGAKFVQAEAKILQKCRDTETKGKLCDAGKTTTSIGKVRTKLTTTITKACQGKDKTCNTVDADDTQPSLTDIGWNIPNCPGFEGTTCTNVAITDCDDIPLCIQCIGEASVNQAIALYYPTGRPSSVGNKALNKCQTGIGKAALGFLGAKSKALTKCWGNKIKKGGNCPADAAAAIATAKGKMGVAINKACTGLDNSTIGLPASCLAVTPEGGASCGGTNTSLTDIVDCVGCVTEFKVDCPDRVSALGAAATYPANCAAGLPTPTPSATATPSPQVTVTPGVCGDNQVQPPEFCDGPGAGGACGPNFPCTTDNTCTCDCPTTVHFFGDPTDPATVLDTGWTGIAHKAPVISNGDVTIALTNCQGTQRPCGVCDVTGPIANVGATQLRNQRCTADTSVQCTNAPGGTGGPCAGLGTCEFYFGAPLPLVAGGVGTCVENQFNGSISGTANVETGEATTSVDLISRVHAAVISTDTPCPACVGDATRNDNVKGGTCNGGPRNGLTCDGNGNVPGRPDFGVTSYDCPPPASTIAVLPIDLSNSTGTVTKAVTVNSPNCSAGGLPAGTKCVCDTCNNLNAEPCDSNSDCPDPAGPTGPICGGRRCIGGANAGAACNNDTQCPSGACARPGEPTKPNACLPGDNGALCADSAPVGDNRGECPEGPVAGVCADSSGHPQRSCTVSNDCCDDAPTCATDPVTAGECLVGNQLCFLDNGAGGAIVAVGMADVPVDDVARPTLAAIFCIAPTSAPAVNIAAGLPGPGRVTIKGTAEGLP